MLKQKIKKGYEIILMLDANDTIKTYKGIISSIQHTCHLRIVESKNQNQLNSYKRGNTQIDFFMVTPFLHKFISSFIIQSFDYICHSDHRAMLMAIDIQHLLYTLHHQQTITSRAINSNTPKQIKMYKQLVFDKMSKPHIKQQISELTKKLHDKTLTSSDLHHINTLDQYFTTTRLDAENSIRKYNIPHPADWSIILHQAYFTYQYWLAIYKQRILGDDYSSRIKKILSIISISHDTHDPTLIKNNITTSKQTLDDIRENSIQHREQFLIDRSIAMELQGNLNRAQSLKQLRHIEMVRHQFRKLRLYLDKHTLSSPRIIQIPNDDGTSFSITDTTQMHQTIM